MILAEFACIILEKLTKGELLKHLKNPKGSVYSFFSSLSCISSARFVLVRFSLSWRQFRYICVVCIHKDSQTVGYLICDVT